MNRKIKIVLIVALVVLVVVGIWLALSFFGNPIGKAVAKRAAREYLATTYGDTDYQIDQVRYDFKSGDYAARITSPSSPDTVFEAHFSGWGKLTRDDYPYEVGNKFTTYRRVTGAYADLVRDMLEAEYPPDYFFIAFGDLGFDLSREMEAFGVPDFTLPMSALERDKDYDVRELGEKVGMLTFYASSDEISYAEAARILLALKKNLDKHDIPFRTIDFVLEKPRKDGVVSGDESIQVLYFPESDLYPEGLEGRLEKAHEKALAYFARMDKENREEREALEEDNATP